MIGEGESRGMHEQHIIIVPNYFFHERLHLMSVEIGYRCQCPRDENIVRHHHYSFSSQWQMYHLTVTDSTLHMVRQWCRIFANANRFVKRVKGEGEMLLNFFVERPVGAVVHVCMRMRVYIWLYVCVRVCLCLCLCTCVYFFNIYK